MDNQEQLLQILVDLRNRIADLQNLVLQDTCGQETGSRDIGIEGLVAQNKELQKRVAELDEANRKLMLAQSQNKKQFMQEISEQKINEYVEEILKNENFNISYLPDWVERQIYKNCLNVSFKLANKLFETASVKFMGHHLKLEIEPDYF